MSHDEKVHEMLGQIQRVCNHGSKYPEGIVEGDDGWPEHVGCGEIEAGSYTAGVTHWYCCGECHGHWVQEPPDLAWKKVV